MSVAAWTFAAFVAGAWLLQQQGELPTAPLLASTASLALAVFAIGAARVHGWRAERASVSRCYGATIVAASFALGMCHAAWFAKWQMADELAFADEGRDVRIVGVIASLPAQLPRGTRFEFDVEACATVGVHVPEHISLAWFAPAAYVQPGERWQFTVRMRRPHGPLNPGGFDLEAWMLERGLRATGYVREAGSPAERLDSMVWRGGHLVDRARQVLREKLQQRLAGQRYGGVLVALVLGDQRAITEDDWRLFNRTGISHLVSISGLHITMIAGLVGLAAGTIWRRSSRALGLAPAQSATAVAALLGAWAYCMLAGWGVPAQRTFFMLATVAIAMLARLGTRPATTLALAAGVATLLDPWCVLAPGFWLSFGAVAAIFLAMNGRPRERADGRFAALRARVREAVHVQAVVTIALLPLTVVLFQQVSVISPLANAIAIPLISLLVTPLALVAACFVVAPEPLGSIAVPLLAFAHALTAALVEVLQWSLRWPGAAIVLPAPSAWGAALAVLGAGWLIAPQGWPLRWAGAVWIAPLFLWPAEHPKRDQLWITALDVGQGSAMVVETGGRLLIFDAGPRYSPQADAGSRIVLPYLRTRGVARADYLVVSHLDSDHSGGTAALLKSLEVGEVLTSIEPDHPALAAARVVRRCRDGQVFSLGRAEVRIVHPTEIEYGLPPRNTNARSCVLRIQLGTTAVLLTGDLPAAQELELLARTPEVSATVVAAPHHGSRSSSSEPFVRAVAPTWVVAQAGYRNRFGHPHPAVVARYLASGAEFIRTDYAGATQWRCEPDGSCVVRRQRIDARRYWYNQPVRREEAGPEDPPAPLEEINGDLPAASE